ncbi:MAG TPA: DUF362 domain-containing protein [Clostridia bacterium]|nr:DUF362 domain-containing protein [Clostridia bacterium]
MKPNASVVKAMVDRAVTAVTGEATVGPAWRRLVTTQDVVGLKVFSPPGPNSGTRAAVVGAIIEGLLSAGVRSTNIVIWDREETDLRLAGFMALGRRYQVRVAGSLQRGFDAETSYESSLLGNLVWGDLEFGTTGKGVGRKSHVSRLLTREVTKLINIAPLLNHNQAGVSGVLYSLASGSVDNFVRFESDRERLATAIPEIYALPILSDRVVLNVTDALLCQYEGGDRGLLHYSTVLNEIRMSRDPVALDALSLEELARQRKATSAPTVKGNQELYDNAALLELGVADLKKIQVRRITGVE